MALTLSGSNGVAGVDGSAGTPALQGSDSNTGIAFGADTIIGSTGGSERFRCDSSGRWLLGTSTSRSFFPFTSSLTPNVQIDGGDAALSISNSAGDSTLFLANRSTITASNTALGQIAFTGNDGTNNRCAARIVAKTDAACGSGDLPGRIEFHVTADSSINPSEVMRIQQNGAFTNCLGIYNDTTGTAANMVVNSSGSLQRSTSSAKYKTNIETLEDQYADALLNCRPVWYRSTCAADNPDWGWWGLIAEEVAEIDPRLVHWKITEPVVQKDGSIENVPCEPEPEGVAYDRFVPHLLNLIKRQQAKIETLETRLAALEVTP